MSTRLARWITQMMVVAVPNAPLRRTARKTAAAGVKEKTMKRILVLLAVVVLASASIVRADTVTPSMIGRPRFRRAR